MTKLANWLAVMCLISVICSSLPGSLSVRPFAPGTDKDAVISVTVDPSMDELNPTDSDSAVTSTYVSEADQFSSSEEEDTTVHPCYALLAQAQTEGRTDAATTDGDIPLAEVECRRMLGDYSDPKPNTNPKCSSSKRC